MHRKRHRSRLLHVRIAWVVAAIVLLNLVAAGAVALALMPTDPPPTATNEAFGSLLDHQAIRSDVHAEPAPPSVLDSAGAIPTPEIYDSPIARVQIPVIGVNAGTEVRGIDATGAMEAPTGPDVVAWYSFTPKPGHGGNAVLSGHVDYINHGPAVFWDLKKLVEGDTISVVLEDGTVLQYAVSAMQWYDQDAVPMADVLAPTSTESITLITCGGSFSNGKYSQRLVVRATRSGVVKP